MKTDLETIQDLFKISYETFESSREEELIVRDLYHNRQYTDAQLNVLAKRGQPAETFNVVKLFARLLVGYYSTVVNAVKVNPRQEEDTPVAMLLHDVVQYTFENNHFETEGDKIKLDGMLSGLMCVYEDVVDTGDTDEFDRPIRRIELSHVPSHEILLDPMSRKEDYSDAQYIHRFKWVSEDFMRKAIKLSKPGKVDEIMDNLEEYDNHVNQTDSEFTNFYKAHFTGLHKQYNNYLLVQTVIVDEDDKAWSVQWCADEEISRKEITYKEVRFPFRVQRIHTSDKAEYYGLFREVVSSQHSINQALIKTQQMANSSRAFVEDGAVEDLDEFTDCFNRINAVVPVRKLNGIKIENLSREVLEQYAIIDKALDRIQRVLGINDSFLGQAYAADSGRKVKLQQNATTMALRYVTTKIEQLYRLLGWDIVNLVKQYYTATETLRIADNTTGDRWVKINKPMQIWSGETNQDGSPTLGPDGQPIMRTPFEEVTDPSNGEPLTDADGNYVIAPIPEAQTEVAFTEVDLSIDTTAYNDEDERNQLMLESIMAGPVGQMLIQYNPAGFFKAAGLSVSTVRTKHSGTIGEILEQTSQMVAQQGQQQMPQQPSPAVQQPKSQELKLPQNTNEGI